MSKDKAEELGLTWLAEIGAHGNVAGPDNSLQSQPSNAINQALRKAGLTVADLDLIEINEAFASVALQSMADLGVAPRDRQRQRRGDRAWSPDRDVGRPAGADARPGTEAARRRPRRCGAVRRWRPGRCTAPARPVTARGPPDRRHPGPRRARARS